MAHERKNLKTVGEIVALLEQARALSLRIAGVHFADAVIGHYSVEQALERFKSLHTTLYVAVHDALPGGKS